ncbi:YqfO protein [Niallia circulans]|uniref:Nif3-like dinuclear metal center hexameric protein n=1 Tax=Niallia circulans TaxID=1397 RepID=UPI00077C3D23|nr:Nif3-like dinuclear metal center hexameric protein [Niallia circulans]MDR4314360.1 Nif3-like dinuclear metal center hexameric protein [Niallia circulans]MED3839444.1 Nif3-like dinuclear metal center hexameric protein [Niallia circulans]MED4242516.1 Nif3-like dinuclear metal center hexameric protein [Niallia circulans]MED4246494.1 Nif3-like dinuclear metal center hexameric protein [Niallia circulans]QKH62249.1 Nif3-like dinuclear metal center hexameric protein [Niallia circulans]
MKNINGYEIISLFEQFSPKVYAMEGDKIGLQVGDLSRPVKRVMIALDVLDEVVEEAISKKVDLIIAHHPPIFRSLSKITMDNPAGKLMHKLIKNDIAVYAAHTNLDVAKGGVNDLLSDALGIQDAEVLVPTYEEKLKKLVVYVPKEHVEQVKKAIGDAGAGSIGNYSHCVFSTEGIGEFQPLEGAVPYIGSVNKLEQVEEVKIESVYLASKEKKIVRAMVKAHPYEEVAYDIYDLQIKGEQFGLGRIGRVEETTLGEFADHVKKVLDVNGIRVVGNLDSRVKKVAVLGGDGNKYYSHALMKGADVYITGDMYYHVAHDAQAAGLNIIDPGHNVEKVMKNGVTKVLKRMCDEKGYDVEIFPSLTHTDPFTFV